MICTEFCPSSVTLFPPSMTMWMGAAEPLETGGFSVLATGMVTSSDPQSNVMMPPLMTAAFRASKVQLAAVPVPTTVVGLEVSASFIWLGTGSVLQDPSGLPAGGNAPASPASVAEAPDDEPAP